MTEKYAINSSVEISEHLVDLVGNFRSISEVDFIGVDPLLRRGRWDLAKALNLSREHLVISAEQSHFVWLGILE